MVQTAQLFIILHESGIMHRQVFTDGRRLPLDPNPSWMGYSVGRWENDVLVVNTSGFNGKAWLDSNGHATSEALQLIERFRRRDFGHMEIEITLNDPKMFSRPWTVTEPLELLPDSELMEFVCKENEKDLSHLALH